jgi:two-component sensor histidine kinase
MEGMQTCMDDTPARGEARAMAWLASLPLTRNRPLFGYVWATLLALAALWLRHDIDSLLPPGFPFLTFFPAVIASAFLFGLRPGILAALLCGFFSRWFFMQPAQSLSMGGGAGMGMALYFFVVAVDIALIELIQRAFRQARQEREIVRRLADHRQVLFHELQHRVGNNLQMVGSLLALQKRGLADPAGRTALDEASRRLNLIGRIQRQLYDPSAKPRGVVTFLSEIVRDVVDAGSNGRVVYRVEGDPSLEVGPDSAIPLALMVAESVANAIEHGFAGRDGGVILLAVLADAGAITIRVENDGNALADGFDPATTESLGLRLARSLAAARGGNYVVERGGLGTVARIVLPKDRPSGGAGQ